MPRKTNETIKYDIQDLKEYLKDLNRELKSLDREKKKIITEGVNTLKKIDEKEQILRSRKIEEKKKK